MYKGKEVCQGCKTTGVERTRHNKTDLCGDCKKLIKIGRAQEQEAKFKYVDIRQHYHAFSSMDFDDSTLNKFIHELLRSLDCPDAEIVEFMIAIKPSSGDNCGRYKIPQPFVEPLTTFMGHMDKVVRDLRKQKDDLPYLAEKAVREEKTRIYNEGVEKGRDLLFALNSGTITLEQFNEKLNYKID